VKLARHDASGTQVAIKYLRGNLLADPEFAALFRAEAAVLASLDDRNVVRLYEYVESPAGAAIVMELIDGVSLRDILARQGKTTAEAALVVLQGSLLGLAAAHRHGVVHRDYKPENVLIDGAGASKLTDFGIAARAGDSPIPAGTLAYAPPEQFNGSPASPATDVYAATATFYECLTGRPPFDGNTEEALLRQHQAAPVPLEPVPEPLRPLVAAGLAKDPRHRPADGTELVAELRAVAGGAYGPDWENRGRAALAAAALLLLPAALGVAALGSADGSVAAPGSAAPGSAAQGSAVHRARVLRHFRPRHIGPAKGAIAAATAIAVAAVAVVATHHKPAGPAEASFTIRGGLGGVAATSAGNAWAVGYAGAVTGGRTLIARWNGTAWTTVPSPDPGTTRSITGVAAASASRAWAVGCTDCGTGISTPTSARALIMRWNGTAWTTVPNPSPVGSILTSVAVGPDGTAWAAGYTDSATYLLRTLIMRWNGTAWTTVPSPDPGRGAGMGSYLSGVAAGPDGTAWAVGYSDSNGIISALILRWNGTTWTTVPSPSPTGSYLSSVVVAPGGTAWAAGYTQGDTSLRALVMRWNGTAWTTVPNPGTAGSLLYGVTVAPDGAAWAVGCADCGAHGSTRASPKPLILRWNGTAWMAVPSPDPGPGTYLYRVTALSGSDAWAVGITGGKTLILRWNGQKWSGPTGQVSPAGPPASSAAPSTGPSVAPSTVPSVAPSSVSSSAQPTRKQAAQALAALLAQSGTDRATVTQAVGAVAACSPGLSQDETIFSNAASSHQALLGKLAVLPGRSALPAPMLQDLTAAWQASSAADQDFARWTQDEIAHGCSTNYQSDAGYQASGAPDDQATTDKKAFAALWPAIAGEYGLPFYQYNQI
jgi:serine/threonine-protein kinase